MQLLFHKIDLKYTDFIMQITMTLSLRKAILELFSKISLFHLRDSYTVFLR